MSDKEHPELKGGHPPAVKVGGGMRISQHKSPRQPEVRLDDPELNNAALKVSTSPEKTSLVSGAPVRGHADFPAEAIQSFHVKPTASHEAHSASSRPHVIQQPRK